MQTISRTAALAVAVACILPGLVLAQGETAEERAEAFLLDAVGFKPELLGETWLSITAGGKKIGYNHVVVEEAEDAQGNQAYRVILDTHIQTEEGDTHSREETLLNPAFHLLTHSEKTKTRVPGFEDTNKAHAYRFTWTGTGVDVEATEGEGPASKTITCPVTTVAMPLLFGPLLINRGPAEYAFHILMPSEKDVELVDAYEVEVKDKADVTLGDFEGTAYEVRMGKEKHFFGLDGGYLGRKDGPLVMTACPEAEALSGLTTFDPEVEIDWASRSTPEELWRALMYAMAKKDRDVAETCFLWDDLIRNLFASRGQSMPEAQRKQMIPMIKMQMLQSMMDQGNVEVFMLPLARYTASVEEKGGGEALITPFGEGETFHAVKVDGQWKIDKIG